MNLKDEDWLEFHMRFPDASAWMNRRDLQRERENLRKELDLLMELQTEPKRRLWVSNRLEELDKQWENLQ